MDDRPGIPTGEPRQRWRIVFAREAPVANQARDEAAAWAACLRATHLPVALAGGSERPRFVIAAPLSVGVPAEGELADLFLTERLTRVDVWVGLVSHVPAGVRLIDLYDVWIGERTLTAQLAAADHRVTVRGAPGAELQIACARLLAAEVLERSRVKGEGRSVTYDLRPLILDLRLGQDGGPGSAADAETEASDPTTPRAPAATLTMRLHHGSDGPAGRPDEVVRALADALGRPLEIGSRVRERLLTADQLTSEGPPARTRV